MLKIFAFTKYDEAGASSRVRCYNYLKYLEGDFEFTISPLFKGAYLKHLYLHGKKKIGSSFFFYVIRFFTLVKVCFSKDIDIVWIEKELFPYVPIPFELMLNAFGKKIVYDYDDAIFHNYDHLLFKKLFSKKFFLISKYADHIMVGNQYLREYFEHVPDKNITIIPTVIDLDVYETSNSQKLSLNDNINIVWIGTPNTQKYLFLIDDAITALQGKHSINLKLIGVNEEKLAIKSKFQAVQWSAETEAAIIGSCDIGIMPVNDNDFERGKCGFKLIQYMAQGLPTVASPVGANIQISEHSGLLAESPEDWRLQIERLILNPKLRDELGANGIEKVKRYYNYDVQSSVIAGIFTSLAYKGKEDVF
ncbi:TPA: glycosyltransferase family 4 protein [Vibrio parahaemolyticus]